MDYRGRPVFDFALNWADEPIKSFSFDLNELQVGFGPEVYVPYQSNVVRGFTVSLDLATPAEILAYEEFLGEIRGRLLGFWLPNPSEELEAIEVTGTRSFRIGFQSFSQTWQDQPSTHLQFNLAAGIACAGIVSVTADLDGYETVTIDADILTVGALPSSVTVNRLHYVRMADDTEKVKLVAEGFQQRTIKVVELTKEYSRAETGECPIYLYHFFADYGGTTVHWRYTSFGQDVDSGGETFTTQPINHGALSSNLQGASDLELEAVYTAGHPLAEHMAGSSAVVLLELLKCSYNAPDDTMVLLNGQVVDAKVKGKKIIAMVKSLFNLDRKFPRFAFQPRCNYRLFELPCPVDKTDFNVDGSLFGASAFTITLTSSSARLAGAAANYYAGGYVTAGVGATYEVRTIRASTAASTSGSNHATTLTLNAPFRNSQTAATIYPGCDGRRSTCADKFNAYESFGGFPAIPDHNLSLTAIPAAAASPGKK